MNKPYIFYKNIGMFCLVFLLINNSSFLKAQIYVKADASGANNGTSWTNAYTDLQDALDAASSGTQIVVAKGTYKPSKQWNIANGMEVTGLPTYVTFRIEDGIEVYGGFAGNESNPTSTAVLDARNFTTNETILSGDLDNNDSFGGTFPNFTYGNYTNNARTIIYTQYTSSATIVDGFTLTSANVYAWYNNGEDDNMGSTDSSNPTINNIIFKRNSGVGLYNDAFADGVASPILTDCQFIQNTNSNGNGAGMFNKGGSNNANGLAINLGEASPILHNCTFEQNVALGSGSFAGNGGAIFNDGSLRGVIQAELYNCTFIQNYAQGGGGAVYINGYTASTLIGADPDLRFEDCTFTQNEALNGGVCYTRSGNGARSATPHFERCIFKENKASGRGGAFYNTGEAGNGNANGRGNSSSVVINCLFEKNEAAIEGGAIMNLGGAQGSASSYVVNSTFYKNTAPFGGAIYNWGAGSGISNNTLQNCIFFENTDDMGNASSWGNDGSVETVNADYCLLSETQAEFDLIKTSNSNSAVGMLLDADPVFVDANNSDFSIQSTSPAIGAGSNDAINIFTPTITTDILGNTRIQQTTIDMGAYESPFTPPVFAPEINVRQSTTDINDGGSFVFSGSTFPSNQDVVFTIQNTGDATLNITSITANGDFSIQGATPSSIAVNDSETITVRMNGSTSAGSKSGTLTINNDDNNEGIYDISLSGNVAKSNQSITFNSLSAKTFGDASFNLSATGGGSGNVVTFTSSNISVATISGNTVTIVGAGSTNITASQAGSGNYNAASDVVRQLTINKANQTITFNLGADANKTYGDDVFTVSATTSSGLPVIFSSGNDDVVEITGNTVRISGGGTTNITASQVGNDNYNIASNVNRSITVAKADLTVTADDKAKVQGDANPPLTISYSGFQYQDDASELEIIPIATTTATTSSPIGTYPITVSGGDSESYNFIYQAGTLTIAEAVVTVTADNQTRAFGEANPTLTFSYSGFDAGESEADLDILPTISTTATETSSPGGYPITLTGGSDTKYAFVYENAVLTVTKATQTITFELGSDSVKSQVDADFGLLATTTSNLDITFTSSDLNVATISDTTVTIVGPGTTVITASQVGDENYEAATDVIQTLRVEALVTSLDALEIANIRTFPNPTQAIIQVDGLGQDETLYILTDNLGNQLISGNTLGDFTLDLTSLPVGMYQITLISDNQEVTKKIIKE